MQIQQINRTDPEKAWIVGTNSDGQTITQHHPVFKFLSSRNAASVSTNEYGARHTRVGGLLANDGCLVGLADEDMAAGSTGLIKVYGYHESCLVMRIVGSVTVRPGHAIGPGSMDQATDSAGLSSTGVLMGFLGPVIALDTITATLHSLGTVGANYANHVFIRCV